MITVKQKILSLFDSLITAENMNAPLDQIFYDTGIRDKFTKIYNVLHKHINSNDVFDFILSIDLPDYNCHDICLATDEPMQNLSHAELELHSQVPCHEEYKGTALKIIETTFDESFGQLGNSYFNEGL